MTRELALIAVHGMGRTKPNYADEMFGQVQDRLGDDASRVYCGAVYYQNILQPNEDTVWGRVQTEVGWGDLRKFLLFGFADAAGFEDGKEKPNSVYERTQMAIAEALLNARREVGDGPVVIVAHSLGCQVISCYYWDAKEYQASLTDPKRRPDAGIWRDPQSISAKTAGGSQSEADDLAFLGGSTLRAFLTTGCNIPIFVAAHATVDILPYTKPHFEWKNYYAMADVLGWPLKPLSPQYGNVVEDYPVQVGGNVLEHLTESWNPLAHNDYWKTPAVLDEVAKYVRSLLNP